LISGCSSVWSTYYKPNLPTTKGPHKQTESAQVRVVEPERMFGHLEEENRRINESNIALEDEPKQARTERRGRFLLAIRLKEKPEDIVVLGYSSFFSPTVLDPRDGTLEAFARSLGADYAAVSSRFAGTGTRVISVPSTTAAYVGSPDGPSAWGTATTNTPMLVQQAYYEYVVFYLRKLRSGE
jgi:hypothetical protein